MIDLNKLAAEIHEAAVAKGFWDVEDAKEKHLAKMISELGEVVQEDRCGRPLLYVDDIKVMCRITDPAMFDGRKPEGVAAELADFAMMTIDLCAYFDGRLPDVPIETWNEAEGVEEFFKDTEPYVLVDGLAAYLLAIMRTCNTEPFLQILDAIHTWLRVRGYDLWEIIRLKMEYNRSRPPLHGRKY